jgi:hypothetical protein
VGKVQAIGCKYVPKLNHVGNKETGMGQPRVQGSSEGFITRLGHAIDAFNGDAPRKAAPIKADVADAKPLPKKYTATGGRVVRGPLANYVTNALKLAEDMRALAVKEDGIFNRTTPKDVDKVLKKYKSLLLTANTSAQKTAIAKLMLEELFETPTGENLFWDLKNGHDDFYNCYHSGIDRSFESDADRRCFSGTETTCIVLDAVVRREGEKSYCEDRVYHNYSGDGPHR